MHPSTVGSSDDICDNDIFALLVNVSTTNAACDLDPSSIRKVFALRVHLAREGSSWYEAESVDPMVFAAD